LIVKSQEEHECARAQWVVYIGRVDAILSGIVIETDPKTGLVSYFSPFRAGGR
jgi:hypothetical protein